VVLEDLHWTEQPMLDLVDSVVERVHGPVLVLCLARPELLERRPTWGAGKPRAITLPFPASERGRPAAGCRAAGAGCSCPRIRSGL
jgi:hypothetical protein